MKCPSCGHWNRASFPRCFKCGQPLRAENKAQQSPAEALSQTAPVIDEEETVIQVDAFGNETVRTDKLDKLALEMLSLHERKRKGEQRQRQLRSRGAQRGLDRVRIERGIGIDLHVAFVRARLDDGRHVVVRMHALEFRFRCQRRRHPVQLPRQAAVDELLGDGVQPGRPLRVPFAHLMPPARLVGDPASTPAPPFE